MSDISTINHALDLYAPLFCLRSIMTSEINRLCAVIQGNTVYVG